MENNSKQPPGRCRICDKKTENYVVHNPQFGTHADVLHYYCFVHELDVKNNVKKEESRITISNLMASGS